MPNIETPNGRVTIPIVRPDVRAGLPGDVVPQATVLPGDDVPPAMKPVPAVQVPAPVQATPPAPVQTQPLAATMVVCDSHTRAWRLRVAMFGMAWLLVLCIGVSELRNYKFSQAGAGPASGAAGIAGAAVHAHAHPSYTLVFLLTSLAIVALGIFFSVASHDPFGPRLRVAGRRVDTSVKDFDQTVDKRVLRHLAVEQRHLVHGELALVLLEIQQQRHARWGVIDQVDHSGAGGDDGVLIPDHVRSDLGRVLDIVLSRASRGRRL